MSQPTSHPPSGQVYGRALKGVGFNLLVNDFERAIVFATDVLGATVRFRTENFAAVKLAGHDYMYHGRETYRGNALYGTLTDDAPRGVGIELRCYEVDPDVAEAKARALGFTVLAGSIDKPPHGLRECIILDDEGFAWVLSRRLEITDANA
jgi:catechol 2,3-dioxygenase-like lactoylglutathione lyase family enzyme